MGALSDAAKKANPDLVAGANQVGPNSNGAISQGAAAARAANPWLFDQIASGAEQAAGYGQPAIDYAKLESDAKALRYLYETSADVKRNIYLSGAREAQARNRTALASEYTASALDAQARKLDHFSRRISRQYFNSDQRKQMVENAQRAQVAAILEQNGAVAAPSDPTAAQFWRAGYTDVGSQMQDILDRTGRGEDISKQLATLRQSIYAQPTLAGPAGDELVQQLAQQSGAVTAASVNNILKTNASKPENTWWGQALDNSVTKGLMTAAGFPKEFLFEQPVYAGLTAKDRGGSPLDIFMSMQMSGAGWLNPLGGVYRGIDAMNGGKWSATAASVDSEAKREELRRRGRLPSVGERLAAESNPGGLLAWTNSDLSPTRFTLSRFWNNLPETNDTGTGFMDRALTRSGTADAFVSIFADPLTYTPLVTSKFGKVGEVVGKGRMAARETARLMAQGDDLLTASGKAARAARAAWVAESDVGKSLTNAIDRGLTSLGAGGTARNAKKVFKELPDALAQELAEVLPKGREASRKFLLDAFIKGEWNPAVTLRRQLAAALGVTGAVGARGVPIAYGTKTIRSGGILGDAVSAATARTAARQARFIRSSAVDESEQLLTRALGFSNKRNAPRYLDDLLNKSYDMAIQNAKPAEARLDGILRSATQLSKDGDVGIADFVIDRAKALRAVGVEGDREVRTLEGLLAIAEGKAGKNPQEALHNLGMSWAEGKGKGALRVKNLMEEAKNAAGYGDTGAAAPQIEALTSQIDTMEAEERRILGLRDSVKSLDDETVTPVMQATGKSKAELVADLEAQVKSVRAERKVYQARRALLKETLDPETVLDPDKAMAQLTRAKKAVEGLRTVVEEQRDALAADHLKYLTDEVQRVDRAVAALSARIAVFTEAALKQGEAAASIRETLQKEGAEWLKELLSPPWEQAGAKLYGKPDWQLFTGLNVRAVGRDMGPAPRYFDDVTGKAERRYLVLDQFGIYGRDIPGQEAENIAIATQSFEDFSNLASLAGVDIVLPKSLVEESDPELVAWFRSLGFKEKKIGSFADGALYYEPPKPIGEQLYESYLAIERVKNPDYYIYHPVEFGDNYGTVLEWQDIRGEWHEGLPPQFHGTGNPDRFASGRLQPAGDHPTPGVASSENLYGPGLYNTDWGGLTQGYQAKNGVRGPAKMVEPKGVFRVVWDPQGPRAGQKMPRIFNLTLPVGEYDEANEAFLKVVDDLDTKVRPYIEGILDESEDDWLTFERAEEALRRLDDFRLALEGHDLEGLGLDTYEDLYHHLRFIGEDMWDAGFLDDVNGSEYLDQLWWDLNHKYLAEHFDALFHEGGNFTGGGNNHNVFIYLRPEDVRLKPLKQEEIPKEVWDRIRVRKSGLDTDQPIRDFSSSYVKAGDASVQTLAERASLERTQAVLLRYRESLMESIRLGGKDAPGVDALTMQLEALGQEHILPLFPGDELTAFIGQFNYVTRREVIEATQMTIPELEKKVAKYKALYERWSDKFTIAVTEEERKSVDWGTESAGAGVRNVARARARERFDLYNQVLQRAKNSEHPWVSDLRDVERILNREGYDITAGADRQFAHNVMVDIGIGPEHDFANTKANREFLKGRVYRIQDPDLRKVFQDELEALSKRRGKNALKDFAVKLEVASRKADIASEAADIAAERNRLLQGLSSWQATTKNPGLLGRTSKRLGGSLSGIFEPAPTGAIRFHPTQNPGVNYVLRQEDASRWMQGLHFDSRTVDAFGKAFADAKTEQEVYDLIHDALTEWARQMDVPAEVILNPWRERVISETGGRIFGLDNIQTVPSKLRPGREVLTGAEEATKPQMASQLIQAIPTPSPDEVRRLAREWYAVNGKGLTRASSLARNAGSKALDAKLLGVKGPFSGEGLTARGVAKGAHKMWKFAVVTHLPDVVIGGYAGFATGDSWDDRMRRAAVGASLGLLGSGRYILRVAGIEERLIRWSLTEGMNPVDWVPFLAKWSRKRGVDRPFRLFDELMAVQTPTSHIEKSLLRVHGEDWVHIPQTNTRDFIDSWYRLVNHTVNPETDELTRMVLQGQLGVGGFGNDWRAPIRDFLLNTEDGKLLMERMRVNLVADDADALIEQYAHRLDQWLPTPDLKRLRLSNADVPDSVIGKDILKEALDKGEAPKAVFGQESWILPRPGRETSFGRQLYKSSFGDLMPRMTLEKPTEKLNRIPMAEKAYQREYLRLVQNGVEKDRARNIAESLASDYTNRIMFKVTDESRFAKKADFFFPFQQPREELVRVYGSLAMNNKAKILRATRVGAAAFNQGVESGIFFEDNNGEWRMRVRGSALVARALGAPNGGEDEGLDFNVRDLFFLFQGARGLQDGFDAKDLPSIAKTVLPVPGGPIWAMGSKAVLNAFPDLEQGLKDHGLYDILFPFGSQGFISSPQTRRIWETFMMSAPPWELASQDEANNELHKIQLWVFDQMRYEYMQQAIAAKGRMLDANDPELFWIPDAADVKAKTSLLLGMWAGLGGIVPAQTRPRFAGKMEADRLAKDIERVYGKDAVLPYLYEHRPDIANTWRAKHTELKPEDDTYENWATGGGSTSQGLYDTHLRRTLTIEEYSTDIAKAKQKAEFFREWGDVFNSPYQTIGERMMALDDVKRRAAANGVDLNQAYLKEKELAIIMAWTAPDSQARRDWLDSWRKRYEVSPTAYRNALAKATMFKIDPWREARDYHILDEVVRDARLRGEDTAGWVAYNLTPAEQVKYWQLQQLNLIYLRDDAYGTRKDKSFPGTIVDQYKDYQYRINSIYKNNPNLVKKSNSGETNSEKFIREVRAKAAQDEQGYWTWINGANQHIAVVSMAMEEARQAKDWGTYNALKAQRNDLYDFRQQVYDAKAKEVNSLYHKYVDFEQLKKDMMAIVAIPDLISHGDYDKAVGDLQRLMDRWSAMGTFIPWVGVDEEYSFQRMTPDVRRAYVDDLTNLLSADKKNTKDGLESSLRWSYLTDFQRNLLERNLPPGVIEDFKWADYVGWAQDRKYDEGGSGGYKKGSKKRYSSRRSWRRWGGGGGDNELSYAYSLMKQYNQRGGLKEPAAYKEYLALPNDPAVRRKFLREHPDVAEWVRRGPLANMPDIQRYIVIDIMVRHGKWEGDVRDMNSITELAWAHYQMSKYTQRAKGAIAPETYDVWVNMPTGVAKAEYLKQHPEIQAWLRSGPMANMPDMYKAVVQDIMQRYGEWTTTQDPLGEVMAKFYTLPPGNRQAYLAEHPELQEYWRALRSPEEQRLADLSEGYFAIPDPGLRKVYLTAHPELQQYFLSSRQKRYEQFLNTVAQYMGSNPDLFKMYLDKQNQILAELVKKFGTLPMLREAPMVKAGGSSTAQGDRVRNKVRR